jgi:signal transduction histidine kinase
MLSSITRHDFLNNTTGLLGLVDMLNELITDSSALALIKDIRSLIRTINDQILFTRFYQDIGVKAPEWQDVREIICDAARQLRPEGVVIDNSIQGIEVYADTLIGKVFYNLMENSLRHGEHVKNMSFAASETGQGLLITYEDDGVGVSDEDKQKLFQKGFGKHTGLGLFLSKEILAITGIGIRENGVRGKGVRFEILVPKGSYLFKDVE